MAFTLSMDKRTQHYYHVVFHCEGLKGDAHFKSATVFHRWRDPGSGLRLLNML